MRMIGVGNLLQAAVFAVLTVWFSERWVPAGVLMGLAAGLQLLAGLALLTRQHRRAAALASALTLLLVAVLLGLAGQAALHAMTRFGADAAQIGQGTLVGFLAGVPWVVGWPLWQVLSSSRIGGPTGGAALLALLIPVGFGALQDRPVGVWAAQTEQTAAAATAWEQWTDGESSTALPTGAGPAVVLLTPWESGEPGATVYGDGDDLAAAVSVALSQLPPHTGEDGLVLDVLRARYRGGLTPSGTGGGISENRGISPTVGWRSGSVRSARLLPQWSMSQPRLHGTAPARFDSVIASSDGAHRLTGGWAANTEDDADAMLSAAGAGGHFLARHQRDDGRYAYTVLGNGTLGRGYNLPRHAGTTWFLSRLASRTDDPAITRAAVRGMAYISEQTTTLPDGRAFFADPGRDDGKVWVGTTALAALAAAELGHPLAAGYGLFLADSIDERGQVRGEMDRASGVFPAQKQNPYGQGQTLLALAVLVREGHEAVRPAAQRAASFSDSGYAPLGAGQLVILDEHWACIAAQAAQESLGFPAGMGLCQAYLADAAPRTPTHNSALRPLTGPAGGLAEAVVAAAWLEPDREWTAQALAYGRLFVRSAYTTADSPLLVNPAAMLGGFRDNLLQLDVRMDSVQHIGCALLGIEAILRREAAPGSLP
ncbi:MAG: hypothetical protein ACI8RZ_000672 [Myxococcota bacterium]|jgi:hypothetical protein